MPSGPSLVRLQGVSKSYGTGPNRLQVLDGVDLELRRGETTSLVGRSGSGKSTLISLIAGLMRPDSGHVHIGGQQTDQLDEAARARLRAERIFAASRERDLTVLYVTHDERLARQAQRALRLADRKVVPA